MKLIPNWRRSWRMASVQLAAVVVAWGALPADTQAAMVAAFGFPAEHVPAVLGLLVILGRIINQPKVRGE